jgi:hypothetical protein
VGDQSLIDTWMEDADKVLDQWEEQLKQALQDVMKVRGLEKRSSFRPFYHLRNPSWLTPMKREYQRVVGDVS